MKKILRWLPTVMFLLGTSMCAYSVDNTGSPYIEIGLLGTYLVLAGMAYEGGGA